MFDVAPPHWVVWVGIGLGILAVIIQFIAWCWRRWGADWLAQLSTKMAAERAQSLAQQIALSLARQENPTAAIGVAILLIQLSILLIPAVVIALEIGLPIVRSEIPSALIIIWVFLERVH